MIRRRIPSLNWLRVFDAAAQTESFSAAAHILNMSPSAVSQQIGSLEHHLGEKLFVRGARSVKLSDAGTAFLPTVRDALEQIETSASALFGVDSDEQLTVQANAIFATSWLAPRLPRFVERHPNVRLNIACVENFNDGGHENADVIVSFGPTAWHKGETTALLPETVYPVALSSVARSIGKPADLLRHTLIEAGGHRFSWRLALGRLGIDDPGSIVLGHVTTSNMAFAMAAAGLGIALARAPATDGLTAVYGLERCLAETEFKGEGSYILAVHPAGRRRPVATAFRDWLLAETGQI